MREEIDPLLPEEPPKLKGGRPRIDDRAALPGIIVVLKSGTSWEMLPQELSGESGITCWRCPQEWEEDGVWEQLHQMVYASLAILAQWCQKEPQLVIAVLSYTEYSA